MDETKQKKRKNRRALHKKMKKKKKSNIQTQKQNQRQNKKRKRPKPTDGGKESVQNKKNNKKEKKKKKNQQQRQHKNKRKRIHAKPTEGACTTAKGSAKTDSKDPEAAAAASSAAPECAQPRRRPNILITGTPGTGKTTLCKCVNMLLQKEGKPAMQYINVGDLVKEKGFHAGKDPKFDTHIIDDAAEDRLLDYMETLMGAGGVLVDHHTCEMYPERWFDFVVVVTCQDRRVLGARLDQRYGVHSKVEFGSGNSDPMHRKILENLQCEMYQTVLLAARASYKSGVLREWTNESLEHQRSNARAMCDLISGWK